MNNHPLRSVLYMPGANQRAMDKARGLPADVIIFDLEDAVAPDAKAAARQQVIAQLAAGGYGRRRLAVRSNDLATPWGEEDLRALSATSLDTVVLPKVESTAQLQAVKALLADCGRRDIRLWAMIETPEGVTRVDELAAFPGLEVLVMGTTDLASELRVPHRADRLGLQYALGRCVLAARRAGIAVLDGVYLDLADEVGLAAVCEQGRALGFDGKTLIHPKQLAAANQAFGLSGEDVGHAREVLTAWEAAEAEGKGVAVLKGKLVETMHVDDARHTLAMAEAIAALEADA